jgi:HSP20 family protein
MATTLHLEPFRDFVTLREAMNSLLEDSVVRPFANGGPAAQRSVPVDIWQTENELYVRASIPGVRPDELSLSVLNGVLTLKGEHKPEAPQEGARFLRQEIGYGAWERSRVGWPGHRRGHVLPRGKTQPLPRRAAAGLPAGWRLPGRGGRPGSPVPTPGRTSAPRG